MGFWSLAVCLFSVWTTNAQTLSEMEQRAFRVLSEEDMVVWVAGSEMKKGMRVLFVRFIEEIDEFETIGQGEVFEVERGNAKVHLNVDTLKKLPIARDFAVLLGDPKEFRKNIQDGQDGSSDFQKEEPPTPESGYIDLTWINQLGSLEAQSSNIANSYKKLNDYVYSGFRFVWFIDFLSNFGFSYESVSGPVLVRTYYLKEEPSSYDMTKFRISYRLEKSEADWRWTFFGESVSETFTTGNKDEYVFSGSHRFIQPGVRLDWEPGEAFPKATPLWGSPYRIYAEGVWAPSVTAKDLQISRGTSSDGSQRLEANFGYTHRFVWTFMPWLKNYFLDLRYTISNLNLKFQGSTTSEAGGFYLIPENGTYRETQSHFQITLGVRFRDVFGQAFESRN